MKILASILIFIISLTTMAQTDAMKNLAGYVDFGELNAIYGEPRIRINIGDKLLHFIGVLSQQKDAGVSEILKKLEAVRVEVYELTEDAAPAMSLVKKVSAELESRKWNLIVSVQEENEQVRIFMKHRDEIMDGLVVMAVESGAEAVFINIIGEIDPTQVGKVTQALDIELEI